MNCTNYQIISLLYPTRQRGGTNDIYEYEKDKKYNTKTFRSIDDVIKRINTAPEYRDMKPHVEEIIELWKNASCCELCGLILDIQKTDSEGNVIDFSTYNAIDHDHDR